MSENSFGEYGLIAKFEKILNILCSNIFPENLLAFRDQKHCFLCQQFPGFIHSKQIQENQFLSKG